MLTTFANSESQAHTLKMAAPVVTTDQMHEFLVMMKDLKAQKAALDQREQELKEAAAARQGSQEERGSSAATVASSKNKFVCCYSLKNSNSDIVNV